MATTTAPTINDIKTSYFTALQSQAESTVYSNLDITHAYSVDVSAIGDFPYFWQSAGFFNQNTWVWFNNVFQYNQSGYLDAAGDNLATALFNTYLKISYELDSADQSTVNQANQRAQAQVNAVVTDWTSTFGPIPAAYAATPAAKMNYVTSQVLSWGSAGLTLNQWLNSTNPGSLLPNAPMGSDTLINDLQLYFSTIGPATDIMNNWHSGEAQIGNLRRNLNPAPAVVASGWMTTIADDGTNTIVPILAMQPDTSGIQNSLYPTGGGDSFSVSASVTKVDETTVDVSYGGSASVSGAIDWFSFGVSGGASYNTFSFDETMTSCDISLTYNGVTKVTPLLNVGSYDVGHGTGWWAPSAIAQAKANTPLTQTGYTFSTQPTYNYGENGTFGVLSALVISQLPVFTLKYSTSNTTEFQKTFDEQSNWSVGFLGIALANFHQGYYSSTYHYDQSTQTVTITMSPPQQSTSVPPIDQTAYVIGANVVWPGAS